MANITREVRIAAAIEDALELERAVIAASDRGARPTAADVLAAASRIYAARLIA